MLSQQQIKILRDHKLKKIQPLIEKLVNHEVLPSTLRDGELLAAVQAANFCYRAGYPLISDAAYDHIWLQALKKRGIEAQFLKKIESEGRTLSDQLVKLPVRMFSLEKAYNIEQIQHFIARVEKKAIELSINQTLNYQLSPKLDGFAAFDDGKRLLTRGNGEYGTDISRVFDRGLQIYKSAPRGLGLGEIVTETEFFEKNLKDHFSHPRNFTASILREKKMDETAQQAIDEAKSVFVPFTTLPEKTVTSSLLLDFAKLSKQLEQMDLAIPFLTDGLVISVSIAHQALRDAMGHTEKYKRWQIAFKENALPVATTITDIEYQVSKQGRITPVLLFKPISVSGAMLSKCTAHHCGMLKNGLGVGAKIEVIRSGEVIPKLVNIIEKKPSEPPTKCPSCTKPLSWGGDFLYCQNYQNCPVQCIERMRYFFDKIDAIKGFGQSTLHKLYQHGVRSVDQIYHLYLEDFKATGVGGKNAANLLEAIEQSKNTPIEDYRLLSAFGYTSLGISSCRKLLENQAIEELLGASYESILLHKGFAKISAKEIHAQLQTNKDYILGMIKNFQIINSYSMHQAPLKGVVITGTFNTPRTQIEKKLTSLGFLLQKQVSKSTQYLIVGETAGSAKLKKAQQLNIKIISQDNADQLDLNGYDIFNDT